MEKDLITKMQKQRRKTIDKFKQMSSKYIQEQKVELWDKYVDNYYEDLGTTEHPMNEVFNYIAQLSSHLSPQSVAKLFMRRTGPFDHALVAAKTIAFFAKNGDEFYEALKEIAREEKKEGIIDEIFASKLHAVNALDEIEEGLELFQVKTVNLDLASYKGIKALTFENGFIKGVTPDKHPVIGQKIDSQYVFYIINSESKYLRLLIQEPLASHVNKKRQKNWGFITDEKGTHISKVEEEPIISYIDEPMTIDELHERDNISQYLSNDQIILSVLKEIYDLSLPINEQSNTTTIKAVMYKEMSEFVKLQKK